jgi:hypothetical protein
MKKELKCPWCGLKFDNENDLNDHAKGHYIEIIAKYNDELAVVTV